MKNFLAVLLAWNVFTSTSAITCVCNDQTVPTMYSPVCASDGKTYRNAQTVTCMNTCYQTKLRIVANEACGTIPVTPLPPIANIPAIVPPYSSVTLVPILSPNNMAGRCSCPNRGVYSPVCGSDGRTYASAELLGCYNRCYNMNLSVIRLGYCPKNLCICTNSTYYSPVCGSDGKTYRNPKIVECLNICQNKNVAIVKHQPC